MSITIARVAVFYGDLEEATRKFNNGVSEFDFPESRSRKLYFFHDNPDYFLMISQAKNLRVNTLGYNTMLTVTSQSAGLGRDVADQLSKASGILFKPAPNKLVKLMEKLSAIFDTGSRDDIIRRFSTGIDFSMN